ncbi:pilus assembly protein PilB [Marinobacter lipolyticus]|uniref:pilus assembly protein PilB n=1 Tax=Marinobacter lipolyticus TaxID=209639 RepID=UPI001D195C46|nr:pilus assembly protein PilB [Marinobacter lipolyticus]
MVKIRQGFEEKSRLGLLLINRGYLSEGQLADGLRLQRESGQRLGEVLVQAGWISERELERVLRHQSRYRNAAAFFTMVTLPFQPLVSFAASSTAQAIPAQNAGEPYQPQGLTPMNDDELASVAGQGDQSLIQRIESVTMMAGAGDGEQGDPVAGQPDVIEGLKLASNIFVPVLNFLDSDLTISGVHYRDDAPRYQVRSDGGLVLAFPERIEQIRMDNIRVSGGQTPPIGNVTITDIRFHPDSNMTIYTR